MALAPPIPRISISPPPPEDPRLEPSSPFTFVQFDSDYDDDGFRPRHLTPPPTTTNFKRPRSPPTPDFNPKKGLDAQQFQALLRSTRGRSSAANKDVDLRKEIALKATKNKQAERRAMFLSKVQAPPSPTATLTPCTPPESPSIFHYTLPSPGLVSPLALFETLDERDRAPNARVEQVDFRMVVNQTRKTSSSPKPCGLPSLDQISARMLPRAPGNANLQLPRTSQPTQASSDRPSIAAGRLRLPARARPPPLVGLDDDAPAIKPIGSPAPLKHLPPNSPQLQVTSPELQVTTLVVPRSAPFFSTSTTSTSPITTPTMIHPQPRRNPAPLTASNLGVLTTRDQKAHTMLSTLKRRTQASTPSAFTDTAVGRAPGSDYLRRAEVAASPLALGGAVPNLPDVDKYKWRRRSAPADVMYRPRLGFEHPVLSHPAGF